MEVKKYLKGAGIGCGAIIVWVTGLIVVLIVAFVLVMWLFYEPSPTMEKIIAKEGDDIEKVEIGNAYLRQIDFMRHDDVYAGYVFYDVTNDDIPELWVCTGQVAVWNILHIYTYREGELVQLYESDSIGVPSGFYTDGKALIRENLGDVRTWVKYTYDKKRDKIVNTTIPLEDYTPHGEYLQEIWRGTKTLKKVLGLQYDENEEETDTNPL